MSIYAQDDPDNESLYVPDDIDKAIAAGIRYLVQLQRPDGSIADRGNEIAMSALSVMAMASVGTVPSAQTLEGRVMNRCLEFILDRNFQDINGYFGRRDGSRMYGHGIITLMLTELLGMGATRQQNQRIHQALVGAIQLILAAQAVEKDEAYAGGWRYQPSSRNADLSVSVWQLMALRSAKNDGLDVPGEAIELAIGYLENSYTSKFDRDGNPIEAIAGFSYTPGTQSPSFSMTAAGLLAMQVCGKYDSPMVAGSAEWLMQHPPRINERFFFYGLYYYAQGMHQAGGRYAKRADKLVPEVLLPAQHSSGSWEGRGGEEKNQGRAYATTMAILSLSVRYHYLPIYQR